MSSIQMSADEVQHPDPEKINEDIEDIKIPIEQIQINDQPEVSLEGNNESDDEKSFTCEFCGKVLSCATSLTRHTRTARYCLAARAETLNKHLKCPNCDYDTNVNFNFQRHVKSCTAKYRKIVNQASSLREMELKTENRMLREQMEELKREAFRPRVTNISNTQNTLNLQLEHSKKVLAPYSALQKDFALLLYTHYRMPQFKKGLKGVCSVINERILGYDGRKWLISYTPAESTFHRKGKEEAIEIDEKADMLLKDLMPTIQKLAQDYYYEAMDSTESIEYQSRIRDVYIGIKNIAIEGSDERKECVRSIAIQQCVSEPQAQVDNLL
jgi:uncharacterized C2H2 Zn-finger protein